MQNDHSLSLYFKPVSVFVEMTPYVPLKKDNYIGLEKYEGKNQCFIIG